MLCLIILRHGGVNDLGARKQALVSDTAAASASAHGLSAEAPTIGAMPETPAFTFIDLFAGIGGFHAAMKALGGECVYAVEIDPRAARVYEANWGEPAFGDITTLADDDRGVMEVPAHDVLCAGFPCQPFSKSGAQRGMDEARGTLFFNIASIITKHKPRVVLLENVRNLIGPRHAHEWEVIIQFLRQEGYHVSGRPAIFSPHLLPQWMGGTPQVRERVFITATLIPESLQKSLIPRDPVTGAVDYAALGPKPVAEMRDRFPMAPQGEPRSDRLFEPGDRTDGWNLLTSGILNEEDVIPECDLTPSEMLWIDAWDDFESIIRAKTKEKLEGFPYWADSWTDFREVWEFADLRLPRPRHNPKTGLFEPLADDPSHLLPTDITAPLIDRNLPDWKRSHLRRNHTFFKQHWREILGWAYRWGVYTELFPASRRKLEWQAQDAPRLWDTVMHFRPSGIRAKRATYLPALVAINQTSIIGPLKRRVSPQETARLQGLPGGFTFLDQKPAATYRQMGNGVAVGAVLHVFRQHVLRDAALLTEHDESGVGRRIVDAVGTDPTSSAWRAGLDQHQPAKPRLEKPTPLTAPF